MHTIFGCFLCVVCKSCNIIMYLYILLVFIQFFDGVGLPLYNISSSGGVMKSIGAEFLRPDALPGVTYMRGMHAASNSSKYNILAGIQLIQLYKFVCTIPTQTSNINFRCKPPFSRLLRHTWVKAVMLFYSYITRNMKTENLMDVI